ncbi:aldehyde dehydrogenase family protein [Streptomyces sp. ACA25]|uniref:aldehyde dehydrogenase family protein n=1 Tax=Streptomyces sp. ACA25 TaxID=3022596 RepID=UPI0023079A9D|nr:aldehyde dehydrogenase family protein [Streptomyces sp. ACA25]MDB1090334.1 aldehyde dehydrogenase family protein [Streptomyces sp. ACA25]
MTELPLYRNLIDGSMYPADSGEVLASVDPSTGGAWALIPCSAAADAQRALDAARAAFPSWSALSAAERAGPLEEVAAVISRHATELAELETRGNGRLLSETTTRDLPVSAQIWRNAASEGATLAEGRHAELGSGTMALTRREPHGVVLGILAWNSPLLAFSAKAALALGAGNTVIVKPAEQASVSVLRLGELTREVLPPGVLNIVSGTGPQAGDPLVRSGDIGMVSLTGSVETARLVTAASADAPKPLALELGGKSPNVVFADADLDAAARGVSLQGIFTANAGQVCYAGSRILIQRPVYDEMLSRIGDIAAGIRLGDPRSGETTMGPIASRAQYDRVVSYLEVGLKEGAELVFGGRHGPDLVQGPCATGFWVEPTLFATRDPALRICQEEIFGPVAVVLPFDTEDEALALANDSSYGLAAGVWTRDMARARRMFHGLRTGMVWVNTYRNGVFPFEGRKNSGYGNDTLLSFTREKAALMEMG